MTLADLAWLYESGLAERIVALARSGTAVVGICGGYQMLGEALLDPAGVEAEPGAQATGLGLLPIQTTFAGDKRTIQVQATLQASTGPFVDLQGIPVQGYEIHMGRSQGSGETVLPLCHIGPEAGGHPDGAISVDGRVWGSYLHGLFDNNTFRHAWLHSLGWQGEGQLFDRQRAYNRLADHFRAHLDLAAIRQLIW
jgi:adenosylcobyric acid synthase